jgi:hypothetical protein
VDAPDDRHVHVAAHVDAERLVGDFFDIEDADSDLVFGPEDVGLGFGGDGGVLGEREDGDEEHEQG